VYVVIEEGRTNELLVDDMLIDAVGRDLLPSGCHWRGKREAPLLEEGGSVLRRGRWKMLVSLKEECDSNSVRWVFERLLGDEGVLVEFVTASDDDDCLSFIQRYVSEVDDESCGGGDCDRETVELSLEAFGALSLRSDKKMNQGGRRDAYNRCKLPFSGLVKASLLVT